MSTSAPPADPRRPDSAELHQVVEEQAALRRVATLVASGAPSAEVFSAVAQEIAQVLQLMNAAVCRYDEDGSTMTVLAVHGAHPLWTWLALAARCDVDVGRGAAHGSPGTDRRLRRPSWFACGGGTRTRIQQGRRSPDHRRGSRLGSHLDIVAGRAVPGDVEDRLAEFTELVATAIANSQAHDDAHATRGRTGRVAAGGDAGCSGRRTGRGVRSRERGGRGVDRRGRFRSHCATSQTGSSRR